MRIIAIDFETFLIDYPDQIVPTPVCLTWCDMAQSVHNGWVVNETYLSTREHMGRHLRRILSRTIEGHYDALICANAAFELSVTAVHYPALRPLIVKLLRAGKVWDVQIMERLRLISTNGDPSSKSVSLSALEKRYLGIDRSHLKEGPDIWRLRYSELYNVPKKDWPQEAVDYAIGDSVNTAKVFIAMREIISFVGVGSIGTAPLQTAFDFYARMMTHHGFEIDQQKVGLLEERIESAIEDSREYLIDASYMTATGNKKKKKLQEYILENFGEDVPRSPKGGISTKSDDIKRFAGDPLIDQWLEFMTYEKLLTTYVPQMKFDRIHPDMNCIVKTGRSSGRASNYYKWKTQGKPLKRQSPYPSMNIQNLPRAMDVRPCFKAGEGKVLIAIDYGQLELCSIAQFAYNTFGLSDLGDKINAGRDMHSDLACETLGIPYEEFMRRLAIGEGTIKAARQQHKPVTLGVFGGQGCKRIREEINRYLPKEDHITEDDARQLKQVAIGRYREALLFFGSGYGYDRIPGHIDTLKNGSTRYNEDRKKDEELYAFVVSGRYHNNRTYCATANGTTMQSLSADGAKGAVCRVGEACLLGESYLSGCGITAFIHDEIIIECPDDEHIEARIDFMADLMINAMHRFMPDLRITVEASVMKNWLKNGPFLMEKKIWKQL